MGMVKYLNKEEDLKKQQRKKCWLLYYVTVYNLQGEVGIKDITNTLTNMQLVSAVIYRISKLIHLFNQY